MKIEEDKALHFMCCFIAGMLVMIVNGVLGLGWLGMLNAFMVSMALGVGKEFGDYMSPSNRWDWMDIAADALGAAAGVLLPGLLFVI